MMDVYAKGYDYGVPYDGDDEKTQRRLLENMRNVHMYRDDTLTRKQLEKQIVMENLPQGRWVTTEGHEYYFNYEGAVLFAGDPSRGEALPVTRYMAVANIDDSKTEYYYKCQPSTVMERSLSTTEQIIGKKASVQSLAEIALEYHKMYPKSGRLGCFTFFNGFAAGREKQSVIDILVLNSVPYGCFVTEDNQEYYFSREYEVMFGWNPKEQALLPAHHQMYIPAVRVDYLYESRIDSDNTLRRCVAMMDDIYRRAIMTMGNGRQKRLV